MCLLSGRVGYQQPAAVSRWTNVRASFAPEVASRSSWTWSTSSTSKLKTRTEDSTIDATSRHRKSGFQSSVANAHLNFTCPATRLKSLKIRKRTQSTTLNHPLIFYFIRLLFLDLFHSLIRIPFFYCYLDSFNYFVFCISIYLYIFIF